ncbi:hypothetical protein [Gelidibacter gilvus]|uniref:Uncharacterized protein n=1 Tax=Gelidibacter gilvus TaxID=59602 RepID=A0A4Q0XK76_9FLAO|nr:hypothetical protein [Gelidibacter gilvus]RXJ52638.1 hypothetical protein ESZ48_02795 [Gelidibacter gilvus]
MISELGNEILDSKSRPSYSIQDVNSWLKKYETDFYKAISESECGKWSKWVKDNSTPVFPCACPIREPDCIFIELYHQLLEISELNRREEFYAEQLIRFSSHKLKNESVIEWVRDNRSYFKEIRYKLEFDSVGIVVDVRVSNHDDPYKVILIKIDKNDFMHAIEFKRIFEEMEYLDFI